ncbi:MAG: segregation and condensation protein A [Planctomycetota bacterium]|jgi:segregation and condensation protein A
MVTVGAGHEVRVESYRGPLDLLLYLIKEEEVDIYDIPIARILERYLAELARMETIDINAAAEFLLMAATLMEIKSRQLLPPEDRDALDLDEEDPRADLVRQLLEYRRFRQVADDLGVLAESRSRLFGRARFAMGVDLGEPEPTDPSEELREVEIFDLLASFERLMKSILADVPRTIIYDDISVEERIEELVLTLRENPGQVRFAEFSTRAADRADAAGIFSAILEAARRKLVTIFQPEPLGELYVSLRGEAPDVDFAPPPEEQPKPLTEKEMVARRGAFRDFVDLDAEEDLDFAFDAEGRKAINRLEAAVSRAEEAIKSFTKPKPKEPREEPAPEVRQWTGEGAPPPAPGTAAPAVAPAAPAEPQGAGKVLVRQWTDPDRSGQMVPMGDAPAPAGEAAARAAPPYLGRRVGRRSLARGRLTPRTVAPARRPRRRNLLS